MEDERDIFADTFRSKLGIRLVIIYWSLLWLTFIIFLMLGDSELGRLFALYGLLLTLPMSLVFTLMRWGTGWGFGVMLMICALINSLLLYTAGVLITHLRRHARELDEQYAERFR
jgi:hypothetical protein